MLTTTPTDKTQPCANVIDIRNLVAPRRPTPIIPVRVGDIVILEDEHGHEHRGFITHLLRQAHIGLPDIATVMTDGIARRVETTELTPLI